MRRIDVIFIGLGAFAAGGILYWAFGVAGFDSANAGIWSQFLLVIGLLGWVMTYLYRAVTQKMTYVQQLKDYEEAVIQKRYAEMTPEQLAQLQTDLATAKQAKANEAN
jgi:membrane protein implicated in regulation of membrane protease activity